MGMPEDSTEIEVRDEAPQGGVLRTNENALQARLGDELRAHGAGAGLACHGLVVPDGIPLSGAGGGVG